MLPDKKKVIYACYQPTHIMLAERMKKTANWEPVFWYSMPDVEKEIRQKFPNALVQDYYDAVRGIVPPECKVIPSAPVDDPLLHKMGFHESVCLLMMDRLDLSGTLTFKDRWNIYVDQLGYWLGVLNYFKPDYVIMESAPHEPCDYILYALCQELGYKVIMFNYTLYYDRIFAYDSLETGSRLIRDAYQAKVNAWKGEEIVLSEAARNAFDKNTGVYDPKQKPYVIPSLSRFKQLDKENIFTKAKAVFMLNLKRLFRLRSFKRLFTFYAEANQPSAHVYQKQKGKTLAESRMTNREFWKYTEEAEKRKKQLYQFYKTLCNNELNFDTPFIYLPLHYQPEETTSPLGGYYVDQLLIVDLLSKTAPAGWKIYVKEHFSQFVYSLWGEVTRSEDYYKKIVSYPNVELVPMDIDSFRLIDKCRCVATVTGAVSFETVCRGKPAMMFGHAVMYKYCEGMFYTPTREDIARFFERIEQGYKPDSNKIKLWLQAMYEHTYRGGIGTAYNYGKMDIYKEENAANHAIALDELLAYLAQNP